MELKLSESQLFSQKEDLIKRENIIWAVLDAMSTPTGRKISATDMQILFNLINLPAENNT